MTIGRAGINGFTLLKLFLIHNTRLNSTENQITAHARQKTLSTYTPQIRLLWE